MLSSQVDLWKVKQWNVLCLFVDSNEETANKVRSRGGEAHTYVCDCSNREDVYRVSAQVHREVGHVDIISQQCWNLVRKEDFEKRRWRDWEDHENQHFGPLLGKLFMCIAEKVSKYHPVSTLMAELWFMIQPVGNILTQLCQEMKKILDFLLI